MTRLISELFAGNLATEDSPVVPITVFVAILCLCVVISHLLEENRWVNESITAILIGLISGTIILLISKGKSSHILTFDEQLFFIYLLPPIIFNAGFQVKKKQFFHNFLTIMSFGVIGVFISTFIITAGCWWLFPKLGFVGLTAREFLAIGTIFSSTDTVCTLQVLHQDETPLLYSLVFGEGVVNDATSVVLFNAVQKIDVGKLSSRSLLRVLWDFLYLFSTSTALGIAVGLLTAFALKVLYFGRHSSIRELAIMILMAYLSYMLAELFSLSGILTVFFCGILMSHYAWHNVTESSRITTRHVFAMMSFIAETFIFLYVGMDAIDVEKWKTSKLSLGNSVGICSTITAFVLLGRAAFVFPLSILSNYMNRRAERTPSITFNHQILNLFQNYFTNKAVMSLDFSGGFLYWFQVVIWWAGLMRGAVSIALAFKQFTFSGVTSDPVNAAMITNTITVVLFTTLNSNSLRNSFPVKVFGFFTKPLVSYLLPHQPNNNNNNRKNQQPGSPKEDMTLPLLSFEESAATNITRAKDSLSLLIEQPVYTVHRYWRKFDDNYMRPIFGGPRRSNQSEC